MGGTPDDPQRRSGEDSENLFDDLDQYFAPIEDADWPEGEPAAEAPSEPPAEPGEGTGEATEQPEGGEGDADAAPAEGALEGLDVEIELPEEHELLAAAEPEPEDAEEPPESIDLTGEPADEVESMETDETETESVDEEPDTSTAEMGGEEWDRLRAEALAETPAEASSEDGPELEGAGLTVDDLRSAPPPQYQGLPGPEDEGPSAADLFGPESGDEASVTIEPDEPPDAGEVDADEVPEPTAVEAAAEHFASGMRPSPEEVERELLSDLETREAAEAVRIEPATPVVEGPAWEEGGEAVTEEAQQPAAAEPRNMTAALVSGVLLGAAVIALLAIGKGPFVVLVTVVVLLAQAELYAVMRTRGLQPATLLGLVCGGFTVAGAYLRGEAASMFGVALAMGLTVLWYMAAAPSARRHTTANAGVTILGVVYVPFLASFAVLLLLYPGDGGRNLFLVFLGMTVLYDVAAYAIGTMFGNRPLAPTVSPNKSWEGAIGATVIVLLVALTIVPTFEPLTAPLGVGLALIIAVVAPLGDLVESALKRDLGVKDMGSLLPGHGGILDRIDAVLFVAPAAYFFFLIAL